MALERTTAEELTVGIVGGGRGGQSILDIFSSSSQCRVSYIVDRSAAAPAFNSARKAGIETSTSVKNVVESNFVDLVVEATGIPTVLEGVKAWADDRTLILSSKIALLIFNIMNESRRDTFQEVHCDISNIRNSIEEETGRVKQTLLQVTDISLNMKLLSFNAGIEAAHAGKFARGFSIIAQEFGAISGKTRKLADEVNDITDSIAGLTDEIDRSLEKFK